MRVLLDDERNPAMDVVASEWTVVRDVPSLLDLVRAEGAAIVELSLDNDLQADLEGRDALQAIADMALDDGATPLPALETLVIHSANGEANRAMCGLALNMRRHGLVPDVEIVSRPCTDVALPLAADDARTFRVHVSA